MTVLTYNFAAAANPDPLQVVAEVVGDDGSPRTADVSVTNRFDAEKGGGRAVTLGVKTDRLAAGRYTLRVRVSDRATRRSAAASSGFEVR